MFGTYRFVLALLVVANHLLLIPVIGHHAVHAFFVLSGYLMTSIMHGTYGYTLQGLKGFALNRALRLYPPHLVVIAVTVAIIAFTSAEAVLQYHPLIAIPGSLREWIPNLTFISFRMYPQQIAPRLSPPTWALTVELTYYALIGLGISRTALITRCWLAVSVIITGLMLWYQAPYRMINSSVLCGSLPFAVGACMYHHRAAITARLTAIPHRPRLLVPLGLLLTNMFICVMEKGEFIPAGYGRYGYYLNIALHAWFIAVLMIQKSERFRSVDTRLGDYSYPLYLAHWQMGFLASYLLFGTGLRERSLQGILVAVAAVLMSLMLAEFIRVWVDRPIQRYRQRVKQSLQETALREASLQETT